MTASLTLRRDIDQALEQHGVTPRRVVLISPLKERKGIRFAYQVELAGGRTVKARHFGSEAAARRIFELHVGLEEAFARPLAQYGAVLIEEWIEGRPLGDGEAETWVDAAGALLGRLHARPLGAQVPMSSSTRRWRDAAESDLVLISGAGKLTAPDVASLHAKIACRDPGVARVVLVHRDFCAENMLIDVNGRLRVIDNEQLDIAPAALDLGRTFHRWPMSEATWTRFLRAYRSSAPAEPEAIGFWKIVASLETTRVFLQRLPARLDVSLALLRRFAAGQSLSDPP
jgi:Ser/Thr protein kinase RdoA (MazF antagonist)